MGIKYFCSTVDDGTMKSIDGDIETARQNRAAFITKCGLDPASSTLHTLSYGGKDYCRYKTLDDSFMGDGITRESTIDADAVVVTKRGHAILLPLADCIGAVIYDGQKNILMMSHLGRHNLEQHGGTKSIEYLVDRFSVTPSLLKVWISPSAGGQNYPLFSFHNRSLKDVATEQLIAAGVSKENIVYSSVDSSSDPKYFSHSQYLKGNKKTDGRFAVVAVMD